MRAKLLTSLGVALTVGHLWALAYALPEPGESDPTTLPRVDPTLDLPVQRPEPDPAPLPEKVDVLPLPPPAPPHTEPRPEPVSRPPVTFFGQEVGGGCVFFVVDTSGSMHDDGWPIDYVDQQGVVHHDWRREDVLRAEFAKAVSALTPLDEFDVASFNSQDAQVLWPHLDGPSEGMRPATPENRAAAVAWVDGLVSRGDTPTWRGMGAAFEFKHCMHVVLLTDGAPTGTTPALAMSQDFAHRGLGWVPGIPGPGLESVNPRDEGGVALDGPCVENEYMVRLLNRQGRQPAKVDVFGIDVPRSTAYWWFCDTVAKRNGPGAFYEVKLR